MGDENSTIMTENQEMDLIVSLAQKLGKLEQLTETSGKILLRNYWSSSEWSLMKTETGWLLLVENQPQAYLDNFRVLRLLKSLSKLSLEKAENPFSHQPIGGFRGVPLTSTPPRLKTK